MTQNISPKVKIALKQYKSKVKTKSISYEQIFRTQLIYELTKIPTKTKDKVNLTELQKKFPSECLMHPAAPRLKLDPKEKQFADQLDALFYDNDMFSMDKRADLYKVYHHIASCFHIFNDFIEENKFDFHEFLENSANLIRLNTNFHNRLLEIAFQDNTLIDQPQVRPDVVPEVLRTQDITDLKVSQDEELQFKLRVNSLPTLKGIINDESPVTARRIESVVNSSTPRATARCTSSRDIIVEKDQLIAQIEELSKYQFDDTETLRSELVELETRRRMLLDRRNKAQSIINVTKRQHQFTTQQVFNKEKEDPQTAQINQFTGIAARNESKLTHVLNENKLLTRQLEQLQLTANSNGFFNS